MQSSIGWRDPDLRPLDGKGIRLPMAGEGMKVLRMKVLYKAPGNPMSGELRG
jgi:hypothetical protein